MSMKKMLNWFVTVEPEAGAKVPKQAADKDPEVAAEAALARAEEGPVGREVEPRRVRDLDVDFKAGRLDENQTADLGSMFDGAMETGTLPSPDEIYTSHALPTSTDEGFHVFHVERLLDSKYLQGLGRQVKKASILVALEANQVSIEGVIQDTISRDNALDQTEELLRAELDVAEHDIKTRNTEIEEEIALFLEEKRKEMSDNRALLQQKQNDFDQWLVVKRQEEMRLYNTVSILVEEHANPITTD